MATEDNVPTLDEEAIYAEALSELKSGTVRPGLWAKAFAESEGDENKSQALYMRLRVQHEKDRRQQVQNAAAASAADAVRRKAEEFSAMIEQLRLKGYDARKSGDGWIVREPLGGRAKLDSDKSLSEYAEGRISVASRRHDSSDKHVASPTGRERQPDQKPSTQPRAIKQNPHQPPASVVSNPEDKTIVPGSVLRDIRNGWIAAVISGGITSIFAAVAMSGTAVYSFSAWELIDVALVFGLAYGIYRRSRVCAVLLLLYFVQAKVYLLVAGAPVSSMPMALVFIYFFVRAALGAFRYHKIVKA